MNARRTILLATCTLLGCCVATPGQQSTAKHDVKGTSQAAPLKKPRPLSTGIDQSFRVPVRGASDTGTGTQAELAVWVQEPPAGTEIKGTVLLLHGFMATHSMLNGAARALTKEGYRAVLIDLRGFGESTGEHITFGVMDAQDLKQLTDALQQKHLCGDTLGVYGTSYGAASAIQYAAIDPRVRAVIAVAPFASIREEVPQYARHILRGMAAMLTDSDLNTMADAVARLANLDLDSAKPLDAITKTSARILLIHGDKDSIIPHSASERLHTADPNNSELLTIPDKGHLELCFDPLGKLYAPTHDFFDKHLAD